MSWCCPLVSRVTPIVCSAYIHTYESYECHNTYCVKYDLFLKPIFGDKDQLSNLFKQLKNFEVEDIFLSGLSLYLAHIKFLLELLFPSSPNFITLYYLVHHNPTTTSESTTNICSKFFLSMR